MRGSDAERLRNDLDTLRTIVGAELPFEPVDVYGMLVAGAAALLPAGLCLAGVRSPFLLYGSSVPYLVALAVYLVRNYLAAHPSRPCPAAKRRDARVGVPILVAILLPLGLGFPVWARAAGAPDGIGDACVLIFIGLLLLYLGLVDPGSRPTLLLAIPLIVVGLLWPFLDGATLWVAIYSAIGLGMIASGLYMHWQLKSIRTSTAR